MPLTRREKKRAGGGENCPWASSNSRSEVHFFCIQIRGERDPRLAPSRSHRRAQHFQTTFPSLISAQLGSISHGFNVSRSARAPSTPTAASAPPRSKHRPPTAPTPPLRAVTEQHGQLLQRFPECWEAAMGARGGDGEGAFNILGAREERKAWRRGTEHPSGSGKRFPAQTPCRSQETAGVPRAPSPGNPDEPRAAIASSSRESIPLQHPSPGSPGGRPFARSTGCSQSFFPPFSRRDGSTAPRSQHPPGPLPGQRHTKVIWSRSITWVSPTAFPGHAGPSGLPRPLHPQSSALPSAHVGTQHPPEPAQRIPPLWTGTEPRKEEATPETSRSKPVAEVI